MTRTRRAGAITTIVVCLAALGVIWANTLEFGPTTCTRQDNYVAGVRFDQGWPFAWRARYPSGYISPDEWLPWDCGPRPETYSIVGGAIDLMMSIGVLAGLGVTTFEITVWIDKLRGGSPDLESDGTWDEHKPPPA